MVALSKNVDTVFSTTYLKTTYFFSLRVGGHKLPGLKGAYRLATAKYRADKNAAFFPLAVYVVAGRKAQHCRVL
jgi:hypothetical protein